MKATSVLKVVLAMLVVAAVVGGPAYGVPDPTAGVSGLSGVPVKVIVLPAPEPAPTAAESGGFDWVDATIGAGAALAAVALGAALIHYGRPHAARPLGSH